MTPRLLLSTALALVSGAASAEMNFNRIAAFPVTANIEAGEDITRESSAEIIDATADGMVLVHTDSPLGVVGRIDITAAAAAAPLGNVTVGGEPTSVAVIGDTAFVGVNRSESYTAPSASIVSIDVTRAGRPAQKLDLEGIALDGDGGFWLDKVEGLAIAADGRARVSTDNDGVDDRSGETMYFSVGKLD